MRRGGADWRAFVGTAFLVGAMIVGSTATPVSAEPLVRGATATFDIALEDGAGMLVMFDAAVAPDGATVVAGQFAGPYDFVLKAEEPTDLLFGGGAPDGVTLTAALSGFIARFDAAGQVDWAVAFPGAATGVAIHTDGSVGVTGNFEGSFGALTANGTADAFLARYDAAGALQWVVQAGGTTTGFLPFGCQNPRDGGFGVAFAPDGSLYMAGGVTGDTVTFSAASGSPTTLNADENTVNGFVARYTTSGAIDWVRHVDTGGDVSYLFGVSATSDGVVLAGAFRGTWEDLTAQGNSDGVVARLTDDGAVAWAAQIGGEAASRPGSNACGPPGMGGVTVDADWLTDASLSVAVVGGSVVVASEVVGTVAVQNRVGADVELAGVLADDRDLAVARYDLADGSLQWARRVTSPEDMLGGAVLGTASGGAVLTGGFTDSATFGALEASGTPVGGPYMMFVAGWDAAGTESWVDVPFTTGNSLGWGLAATGGGVFAVGQRSTSPDVPIRIRYATATAAAPPAPVPPEVSCAPLPPTVGGIATCTVTGGDPGIDILWSAAYSAPFAEEGLTLDDSGAGEFSFVVPAAALGEELTVELVELLAPVSLGVVGGPAPVTVPAGEGPVPAWPIVLAALVGVGLLRRGIRTEG